MINYITLGTNDFDRAVRFYDELLPHMGAARAFATERWVAWSFGEGATMLCVVKPFDEEPATGGNGTMVALKVTSHEEVDDMHRRALSLGAVDEGSPGFRGKSFYGGYFRELDGNKLNFFCYE